MTLDSYLNQFINLERTGEFHYGRTLERMKRLLEFLKSPQKDFPMTVIVAGSKGKTSTAFMTGELLKASGKTVGLYTSPHVVRWNERIQVNGELIEEDEAWSLVRESGLLDEAVIQGSLKPTYFEVLTAIAFLYFSKKKVDCVVLEVGLGGRFDATNVCQADLVILTPLGLEHQAVLGQSLREIAYEKCGVIHAGAAVITASQEPEAMEVIEEEVRLKKAILLKASEEIKVISEEVTLEKQRFTFQGLFGSEGSFSLHLLGAHQLENASLAYAALRTLGERFHWPLQSEALKEGFSRVSCPGRLEILRKEPWLLLDGAHNTQSAQVLKKALHDQFHFKKIWVILGMLRDKNPRAFVEILGDLPLAQISLVPVQSYRAFSPEEIFGQLKSLPCPVKTSASLQEALEQALSCADSQDAVVVTGSLYLVGEVKKSFDLKVCYANQR